MNIRTYARVHVDHSLYAANRRFGAIPEELEGWPGARRELYCALGEDHKVAEGVLLGDHLEQRRPLAGTIVVRDGRDSRARRHVHLRHHRRHPARRASPAAPAERTAEPPAWRTPVACRFEPPQHHHLLPFAVHHSLRVLASLRVWSIFLRVAAPRLSLLHARHAIHCMKRKLIT